MNQKVVLDEETIKRSLTRITFEMIEQHKSLKDVVLVGIKTRGITIAYRIAERMKALESFDIPVGELDITYFRDDIVRDPSIEKPTLPFSIVDKQVILVDDVLYTGRTIRAALDAIMSLGRAKSIALAVLIDRGHRELPIRPDYIGKNIPTSSDENIQVELKENDGLDRVSIIKEN
ncbi:MAG TPA: bifunctional pyr operon transcriptional regulator/uracil phosphoribosyltransferase PyrR [Erysipelotrichaceae bacterium]|nr:bifunctional pyr operon transcriptional regulator/uracil phosphoribosyltransferase PyrR [Erysipelotrichaceae bacterium]